jgi:hypothetical protein
MNASPEIRTLATLRLVARHCGLKDKFGVTGKSGVLASSSPAPPSLGSRAQVFLFHDFTRRLERFIRDHKLQARVIGGGPLKLD